MEIMKRWNPRNKFSRYMQMTTLGLAIFAGAASQAEAASEYIPGGIYVGGEEACLQGDLFATKWWAGASDEPFDVDLADNAWETPWQRLEANSSACEPEDSANAGGVTDPVNAANDAASPGVEDGGEPTQEALPPVLPASEGSDVPDAASGCPSWEGDAVYLGGATVSYSGENWEAHWWTQGDQPGTTGEWGVWRRPANPTETSCAADTEAGVNPISDPLPQVGPEPVVSPDPIVYPAPGNVALSDLLATEVALTSGALMAEVKLSIETRDNEIVEAVLPLDSRNPENVQRVESIVDAGRWDYFFPRRAPEYTYTNFLRAIAKFPAFCGTYADGRDSDAICRKALATMFAHFTQETGGHTIAWPEAQWRQGLVYVRELGWSEEAPNGYGICDPASWQGETWPCAVFPEGHPAGNQYKSYFGRGAKQLSYNYNYGPFSEAMYGDVDVLLEQPNLVADTWLNLASAVFFYVYPQPPKPSMLHALDGTWVPNAHDRAGGLEPGFGVTTQIINGGVECGGPTEHGQSRNRIEYYRNFTRELQVPLAASEVLGCANMQRFDTQGSGALAINWEQDWTSQNACQLVSYQTPFSAFLDGDYARCVESFFDVTIVDDLG
jgi:chitodextrinase